MATQDKIKIAELEIGYKDVLEAQADLKERIRDLNEETKLLEATQEVLRQGNRKDSEQYKENAKAIEANKTAVAGLQTEYKNNQRVLEGAISAKNEELGTIQKLDARNKELRASLRNLDLTTKEGQKTQKEYIAQINKNTEFIRQNSDAAIQQKMNIGNYQSALDMLPASFKNAASGAKTLAVGFEALIANPVGIVIMAVAAAVMGLVKVFKTFDPIVDKIEQSMAALGAIFKNIQSGIIGLINGHRDHAESMREAVAAAVELKKAEQDLVDIQLLLQVSDAKSKRQIDELLLQSKDRTKSEKERQDLIDQALKLEEEQYNERKKVADAETEIAFNKIIVGRKLTEEQKKQLREQGVAYAIKLKETKAVTDEEVQALATALANQERILNESISIREKAINRQNAIIEKGEEAAAKAAEEQAKIYDERKKQIDEQNEALGRYYAFVVKMAEDEMLAEIELEKQKYAEKERLRQEDAARQLQWETDLAAARQEKAMIDAENERIAREVAINDRFQAELDALKREEEAEIQSALKTGASVSLIVKKYAAIEKAIEYEKQQAKLAIIGSFAGSLAQLFDEETKLGKAAAITQTVINTYKGAMAAFAETPGGIGIKSLAAVTAIATGIAAVRNIMKAGKGGAGGADASISTSGIPGAGSSQTALMPQTNYVTNVSQAQTVLVIEDFQKVQQRQIAVRQAAEL